MPYIKREVKAGKILEVEKYYSGRYGHHEPNAPRREKTKEEVEKSNARRQERELRWLLNANFEDGTDALATLSWKADQDQPETSEEMRKEAGIFFRKLRKEYRKKDKELKYVYTMEIGPKGARHLHAVINKADLAELQSCWPGVVDVKPLFTDGNYAKIASYFIKYSTKTEETEGKKIGRRYCSSHNLVKPKITKTVVNAKTFKEQPQPRKGYVLDESRTESGVSELTGKRYVRYTYVRIAGRDCAGATAKTGGKNGGRGSKSDRGGANRDPGSGSRP